MFLMRACFLVVLYDVCAFFIKKADKRTIKIGPFNEKQFCILLSTERNIIEFFLAIWLI